MLFTVGVDVASFFHSQEEEPVKSAMAVEVKPALPGKQLGKEHGPIEPLDQAKGLCEGQSDSGVEAKVCGEDKAPRAASSRESVAVVVQQPPADTSPSSAEGGVCVLLRFACVCCWPVLLQLSPVLSKAVSFPVLPIY